MTAPARDRFWWIVAGLALARAGMGLALRHGWPPAVHDGWMFTAGGDEHLYGELAYALSRGHVVRSLFTLGYPLFLAPCVRLMRAASVADAVPLVAPLQVFVMVPLSVFVVAWLGRRLTGSRGAGLIAAGLWTVLPYAVWGAILWLRHTYPELQRGYEPGRQLSYLLGLPPCADTMGVALMLAALWQLCRAIDADSGRRCAVSGLLAGCALLTRPSNIALVGLGCAMLLSCRRARGTAVFLAGVAAVMSLQLWYNAVVEGSPLRFAWISGERAYLAKGLDAGAYLYPYPAVFSPMNAWYFAQWLLERLPAGVLVVISGALAACVAGVARLARQGRGREALWLVLWCAAYAAVFLPYYGFSISIIRYLMPVYPAACIAAAVAIHRIMSRPARACCP
jgi:hypothetical protein